MIYTPEKASQNIDIFKIELKNQKGSTAIGESKFQTFPQNNTQNIITQELLKTEYQFNNIQLNHFIHENEMRIRN